MEMTREIVYLFFKPTPQNTDLEKFSHLLCKRRWFGVAIVIVFFLTFLNLSFLEAITAVLFSASFVFVAFRISQFMCRCFRAGIFKFHRSNVITRQAKRNFYWPVLLVYGAMLHMNLLILNAISNYFNCHECSAFLLMNYFPQSLLAMTIPTEFTTPHNTKAFWTSVIIYICVNIVLSEIFFWGLAMYTFMILSLYMWCILCYDSQ